MDLASEEAVNGYLDGRDPMSPEPSANRTWEYRNSWAVGRREIERDYSVSAGEARKMAAEARAKDQTA